MPLVAQVGDKVSRPPGEFVQRSREANSALKSGHESSSRAAREHAKHLRELHERFAKVRETTVELVTPAFAAVGIAGLSAAEAIKSVVEASKKFGETSRMLEMV